MPCQEQDVFPRSGAKYVFLIGSRMGLLAMALAGRRQEHPFLLQNIIQYV